MAYVGIDRGIVDHWIYQDAEYFKVWFEMLYRARYSSEPSKELIDGEIVNVGYGEFIYGRKSWSERLKVSEQRLRTLIKTLKSDNMIEVISEHRKCTLYKIKNYAKFNHQSNQQESFMYQGISGIDNHQSNQQPTSKQPSPNHQSTTKEESKERNKANKEDIYIVVQYLNKKAGKKYSPESRETMKHINARIREGFTIDDFKTVIDNKVRDWLHDPKMRSYLRPTTLFSPSKFEGYLNQGGTSYETDNGVQQPTRGDQKESEYAFLDRNSQVNRYNESDYHGIF